MANKNPWKARLARHTKRTPGSIEELRRHAWGVLMMSLEGVTVEDAEQRRKNILAFWQGAGVYKGLVEVGEHEARLQAVEALLRALTVPGGTQNGQHVSTLTNH